MIIKIGSFFIAFLIYSVSLLAQEFKVPALTGPVVDEAGLLTGRETQALSSILESINRRGNVQIQVATLETLANESIEQASIKITDAWKIGDAQKDNGVLILIAPNDKKFRIEVGQGLEGVLPDVVAKRISSDVMKPFFKKGNFAEGIQAGISVVVEKVDADFFVQNEQSGLQKPGSIDWKAIIWLAVMVAMGLPALGIMGASGGRGRRRGYAGGFDGFGGGGFGGGGFGGGGGGWSGGGGGFSGGGSSDSW